MDLSFLPSATEYNKERTRARFTVRSANSPSYNLTRRTGVRKSIPFSEEKRESTKEVRERERYVTHAGANGTNEEEDTAAEYKASSESHSGVKGQCEMKKAFTKLNQNGTADNTITEFGTDRSENPAFESHGRTESKKYNRLSKSMSLDWKAGARSSDSSTRDGMSMSSAKGEKQAGELEERQTEVENVRSKAMSSVQAYNSAGASDVAQEKSPVSHMSQTWDKAGRGHSLPARMRSQSGHSSSSCGLRGESILKRIEKLYESAGFGKAEDYSKMRDFSPPVTTTAGQKPYKRAEGGTFPRRFSTGEGNGLSPGKTFAWTPQKDKCSDSSLSTGRSRRLSGGQWHEQMQGRYAKEGGVSGGKVLEDTGTRSLDRARSKYTVAAQIRSARAASGITTDPVSNTYPKEEASGSFKDSSGLIENKAGGGKDPSRANHTEERGESKGINKAKDKNELKSSNADEDVFESLSHKVALKTTERDKFPKTLSSPSAASVRNKINQFEALSQRAQSSVHRRAFSVPAQLSNRAIGGLRGKWEGMKEGEDTGDKSQKNVADETKLLSERSFSVDGSGLRLSRIEAKGKDLVANEGTELDISNNRREDFGKYSKLKNTLEIPLNTGAQRRRGNFYVDETDFSKVLSSEEANKGNMAVKDTPPLVLSRGASPSQVTSPVSDDDKTPTNTPNYSPFLSPISQPENATPIANTYYSTSVTPDPESPPLPRPLATSSHSKLHSLVSPDVDKVFPKGKKGVKDLNAWVAGLNSDISVWNDDEDDYEDDDESTQKDEDSNYDSDSGESSVTITSNMSQSDRRSFCVSLSDLCNFAGVDDDSENDSDDWQSTGRRSVSLSSDVSALSSVSVMPSEELDRLLEDVKSLGDNNLQDYDDVQVVVLHKEIGVGLGFSLAGGVDQNKPVTVHKVFPTGVAAQEGSIREGDQVLSINGTALCGYAHWEALRVLRRAKSREMGVVVLRRADFTSASKRAVQGSKQGPTQTEFIETGRCVCVCLEKNSRDLGFTLEGGVGSSLGNRPLTVQKIFQGGPVDKVCPGDEVLEIEGLSIVGMSRLEAWTLIRKLPPGPVNVVLHRPL